MALLFYHYLDAGTPVKFLLFIVIMAPVPYFFLAWARLVWKDVSAADFNNMMKMNVVASVCTNLAFLSLMIWRFFE
jgi:1,4-dihydroxy-2-naphthoate octaprenyltransferase